MSVANILSMAGGLGLFLFGIRTMGTGRVFESVAHRPDAE